jgi:hypothetical protein
MKIDNLQIMDCKLDREERQICRWVVSRSESKDSSAGHGARGKPDLQIMGCCQLERESKDCLK